MIPLAKPWITFQDKALALEAIGSGRLSQGPFTRSLEEAFALRHGYRYGVAVSSGISAIKLIAAQHEHGPFGLTGATFPGVYLALEGNIGQIYDRHQKAEFSGTIVTALYDDENREPSHENPLWADWCESAGTFPPNRCDSAYSFYPNKQLCGGEGGMILTQSESAYEFYRSARNNGRRGESWRVTSWGSNYRITEVSAALVGSQLSRMDEIMERRCELWEYYQKRIGTPRARSPRSPFTFVYMADTVADRLKCQTCLIEDGIEFRRTFPPHSAACIGWTDFYEHTLMLPLFTEMRLDQVEDVCRSIDRASSPR